MNSESIQLSGQCVFAPGLDSRFQNSQYRYVTLTYMRYKLSRPRKLAIANLIFRSSKPIFHTRRSRLPDFTMKQLVTFTSPVRYQEKCEILLDYNFHYGHREPLGCTVCSSYTKMLWTLYLNAKTMILGVVPKHRGIAFQVSLPLHASGRSSPLTRLLE